MNKKGGKKEERKDRAKKTDFTSKSIYTFPEGPPRGKKNHRETQLNLQGTSCSS